MALFELLKVPELEYIVHCFTLYDSKARQMNMQCVGVPTTMDTFHGLNCFSHVIYKLKTSTYQNIAKLLTHPSIL